MLKHSYHCLEAYFLQGPWRLPGDILELGVGGAATTPYLAEAAGRSKSQKHLYACDTFQGLPHTEGNLKKGDHCYNLEFVKNQIRTCGIGNWSSSVTLVQGRIEDTLHSLNDKQFCFAWVDMDLAAPTGLACKWLEDRMVIGGVIGFHDYGFRETPGIKPIVDKSINWSKYRRMAYQATNCLFIRRMC